MNPQHVRPTEEAAGNGIPESPIRDYHVRAVPVQTNFPPIPLPDPNPTIVSGPKLITTLPMASAPMRPVPAGLRPSMTLMPSSPR